MNAKTAKVKEVSPLLKNLRYKRTEHKLLNAVADAAKELADAVGAMDTSYRTSDFLPGEKNRRYYAALEKAVSANNALAALRNGKDGAK